MKLIYTPVAQEHLRSIGNHTKQKWGSKQCDAYITKLVSACESLRQAPEKGKLRLELNKIWRSMHVEKHVVYYLIAGKSAKQSEIRIIAVLHERMEPSLHLPAHAPHPH